MPMESRDQDQRQGRGIEGSFLHGVSLRNQILCGKLKELDRRSIVLPSFFPLHSLPSSPPFLTMVPPIPSTSTAGPSTYRSNVQLTLTPLVPDDPNFGQSLHQEDQDGMMMEFTDAQIDDWKEQDRYLPVSQWLVSSSGTGGLKECFLGLRGLRGKLLNLSLGPTRLLYSPNISSPHFEMYSDRQRR